MLRLRRTRRRLVQPCTALTTLRLVLVSVCVSCATQPVPAADATALAVDAMGNAESPEKDVAELLDSDGGGRGVGGSGSGCADSACSRGPAAKAATMEAAAAAVARPLSQASDLDSDGISDHAEGGADTDSDFVPDFVDRDSDDDGVPDAVEQQMGGHNADHDSDSIPNEKDTDTMDTDGDGFDTECVRACERACV